ncbi:DUF2071 domain-containing protein [Paenibacillus sp. GP183]|uniref:YqjF family protein n=1 Tax=Paenibacillus sp. GP183 TaxID=1882751 RepID=UPI000894B788|nr:DUF2071 domain-containing protein [Paenibacillus sp. GP183]SEC49334.1 hypothetical protein SAMN05443246_4290 [Paenibacillus sp. GP183]
MSSDTIVEALGFSMELEGSVRIIMNSQRPWPVPSGSWIIKQSWRDLLFLHYPVKVESLRHHVPTGLEIDTYNEFAWISVVPFWMCGIRFRGTPSVPYLSNFPELNVRTYVKVGNKPGVYFFSLDAESAFGVFFGRRIYKLPYFFSHIHIAREADNKQVYESIRKEKRVTFKGSYKPISEVYRAEQGTLDYWLVERYCLYSEDRNRVFISEINHQPWILQDVEYEISENSMLKTYGIDLPDPFCAHYCKRLDVHVWPLKRVKL